MKRYKSKTRGKVKRTDRGGEDLSENEQLLKYLIESFEENACKTESDTQKRQSYIKNVKKRSRNKKSNGKIWRDKKT